jgi:hypothetical protein
MPWYTAQQIALIENIAQSLEQFAPARAHAGDAGYGYFRKVRNFMLEYGEIHDGTEYDLSNVINYRSPFINTGSGARLKAPPFDGPQTKKLPKAIKDCSDSLRNMVKDRRLMEREPMLHAYLKFANMQFARAETDHWDAYGYLSDPASMLAQSLFSQLSVIPTAADLRRLQQEDPQAYQTGLKVMECLNAAADYYDASLLTDPKEGDRAEAAAKEAERMRRMDRLLQASQALADTPQAEVTRFMRATGNAEWLPQFENTVYGTDRDPEKSPIRTVVPHLTRQKRLMQQGLTLEEARLLHDFHTVFTTARKDQGGAGMDYQKILEPYSSQMLEVDRLCRECGRRFETGFASPQEKNAFFKSLGAAAETIGDTLRKGAPNRADYDAGAEDFQMKLSNTGLLYKSIAGEVQVKNGVLNRVSHMKQRIIALEQTGKWANRTELNPAYNLLMNNGTYGLGDKNGSEAKNYKAMMAALADVARQCWKKTQNETRCMALGENCRTALQKAEAWLGDALPKLQRADLPQNERSLTEKRVIGTLGVLHALHPEKAEALRQKTAAALGRELSWNEIRTAAAADRDRNPNFNRYFELHSGDAARNIPERKLNEYMAKTASALFLLDKPSQKFDLSVPRELAARLQKSPDFKAAMRAAGPEVVRQTLVSRNIEQISSLVNGGPERYAISEEAKRKLQTLSAGMRTEQRSEEWKALKQALANGGMKDSRSVFSAVEAYVKGKKSVSRDPQRRESVKLALDALAIVAENGDDVARARAQILVDRFNEVREAHPGDRNHVDLRDYGHVPEPEAPARVEPAPAQPLRT